MTGLRMQPPPRALVAYWGYGDVDGDWYTKPSDHYRKHAPLVTKEEALKGVGTVVTGAEAKPDAGPSAYYLTCAKMACGPRK